MTTDTFVHRAVLLNESIAGLNIKPDGIYIDATFGRGGHSAEILKQLSSKGRLIALDRDDTAIMSAQRGDKSSSENKARSKLHPRNLHKNGYDFDLLTTEHPALLPFVITTPAGTKSIHFSDNKAVKTLNQALLKAHYNIG